MKTTQQVRVDPNEVDEMEGCKGWECVVELDGKQIARLAVDRLPLHTDEDIFLQADYDMDTPHEPVFAVCDEYELHPHVATLLACAPQEVMDAGYEPSILVTEAPEVEPEWRELGVDELLLARLLTEVQSLGDVLCAVQLSHLGARAARSLELDRQRAIFHNLSFVDVPRKRDLPRNVMLMPDWRQLHGAKHYYEQRFAFLPPPQVLW